MIFFFFSSRRRHTRWNCDWSSDVCSSDLDQRGKRGRATVVGQPRRHGHARTADLLIGIMGVLKAEVSKKFVLDDWCAEGAAGSVAMQFRNFVACRDVGVSVVEKWSGVEGIGPTVDIGAPMDIIRSGSGADVNVRAAGGALLRVVHGSVHAKFLDGFRSGSGESLADCQVRGRGALDGLRRRTGEAGSAADAGVVHDTSGSHRTCTFPVEQVAGVDTVHHESVAGVALPVGPDGLISQSIVHARPAGKFRVYAR